MRPHQPTPTPHMKGDNRRQRETRPLQSPRSRPHQPTPNPHMKGDNGRQRETRPLQSPRSRPHQPTPTPHMKGDNGRQRETRPFQSPRSRPHQPTPTPHMKGDNGRQRETRPLQSPRSRPQQPTPTPHMKGDNRRQWETTGDKTTSEPKKPTTPTNTKAARSKVALRTPTVNCLGKKHTVLHPSASPPNLSHSPAAIASSCNCCSSTGNIDGESSDAKTSMKASLGSLRGWIKGGINFLEVISCMVPWQGFFV